MNEGEFKKRINQIYFSCYEWSEDDSPKKIKKELCRTVEEAKKDIFEPIEDMIAYVLDPKNKNDLTIGVRQRKLVYALIKWFGDKE
jgi:hypothetical protein